MEYEVKGNNLVIRLPEELDHHSSRTLQQDTEHIMKQNDIHSMIFDFSRVMFMDSSGIGIILGRYKKMSALGGKVSVCGPGKRIRRILRMSGIEKITEIYDTVDEAIQEGKERRV